MLKLGSWLDVGPGRVDRRRAARAAFVAAAAVSFGLALAPAQSPDPAPRRSLREHDPVAAGPEERKPTDRIREGTELVRQSGRFRLVGDRVVFAAADSPIRYVALENLNLERIVRTITANPGELEWSVSGVVTEYQGSNYLLVRRAVLVRNSNGRASRLP